MYFNRAEVKYKARKMMRQARPRPTLVCFVYLLAVSLVSFLAQIIPMLPDLANPYRFLQSYVSWPMGGGFFSLFISILIMLYAMVMGVGFVRYTLHVWRGQPGGYGDLFSAFSLVGRVLSVNLLIFLFSFLWSLLGILALLLFMLIGGLTGSSGALILLTVVGYIAFLAFIMNRVLRFVLVNYLLLDHPEMGAMELLRESKRLMKGRIWSYFVLSLSFLGWYLLMFLIIYVVAIAGTFGVIYLTYTGDISNPLPPLLFTYLLAFLAMSPLSAWVTAYSGVTSVGFYEIAAGITLPTPDNQVPNAPLPTYIPPTDGFQPPSSPSSAGPLPTYIPPIDGPQAPPPPSPVPETPVAPEAPVAPETPYIPPVPEPPAGSAYIPPTIPQPVQPEANPWPQLDAWPNPEASQEEDDEPEL